MIITLGRLNIQTLLIALVLSGLLMSCGGGEGSIPSSATPSTATPSYPLTVASTARHVVDQSAKPFLLVGDTAWSLFVALSDSDADLYLENRKQHGFTAVLASLIEHMFAANPPARLLWNDTLYRTTLHHATRSLLCPCRPGSEVSGRERNCRIPIPPVPRVWVWRSGLVS